MARLCGCSSRAAATCRCHAGVPRDLRRSHPRHGAFQFPPYTRLGVRWCANVLIPSTIGHILALKDTADFHVTDHLRFIYLFDAGRLTKATEVLPAEIRPFFEAAVLRFKFSVEDAHSSASEEMTFWSQNHQVLFASCEYLAGQLSPEREFQHADGAGDKHDGAWHRDRAGKWLRRWLDRRMKLGFSEWNAPGYYNEDLRPLNVADFCRDAEIASMARTVIDLMVFDLARFTCQGNFGARRDEPTSNTSASRGINRSATASSCCSVLAANLSRRMKPPPSRWPRLPTSTKFLKS